MFETERFCAVESSHKERIVHELTNGVYLYGSLIQAINKDKEVFTKKEIRSFTYFKITIEEVPQKEVEKFL